MEISNNKLESLLNCKDHQYHQDQYQNQDGHEIQKQDQDQDQDQSQEQEELKICKVTKEHLKFDNLVRGRKPKGQKIEKIDPNNLLPHMIVWYMF